jgi:hypothetical protein
VARSPERGTAYFVDATDRRVIATENLRDGERVRINPDGDEITVDGRAIYDSNLVRRHDHSIWWLDGDNLRGGRGLPDEMRDARRGARGPELSR